MINNLWLAFHHSSLVKFNSDIIFTCFPVRNHNSYWSLYYDYYSLKTNSETNGNTLVMISYSLSEYKYCFSLSGLFAEKDFNKIQETQLVPLRPGNWSIMILRSFFELNLISLHQKCICNTKCSRNSSMYQNINVKHT